MKIALTAAALALVGLGTVALTPAQAAIVCSGDTCWHVRHHYHYPPGIGVVVHDDHWRWGPHEHYAWREHAGRGYWRNGVWVGF
jgi:hypothetical protein